MEIFKLITFLIGLGALVPLQKPADDMAKFSVNVSIGGSDCKMRYGDLATKDYLFTAALSRNKYSTSLSIGTMNCRELNIHGPVLIEPSLEKYNLFYVILQRDVYYKYFGYKLGMQYINARWPYWDYDDTPPIKLFPILGIKIGDLKRLYLTADLLSEPILASYFNEFNNASLGLAYNLGINKSKIWIGAVFIEGLHTEAIMPGYAIKADLGLLERINLHIAGISNRDYKGFGLRMGVGVTF